uniref:Uncharacterized protein n=1 Tax=Lactuca sativa TaxID=4236 RepID=A0A9R1XFF6_LACSA|nr:hypothetical protein LSAT_V11C400204090 [Lactuca sativa]
MIALYAKDQIPNSCHFDSKIWVYKQKMVLSRKYFEGRLAFYVFVDTDLFSIHDLNDMIRKLGELSVYVEHGQTRVHTYFMSPTKVVIQQMDDDPSPELIRIRLKKKEVGSCSKKLDMNVLPK